MLCSLSVIGQLPYMGGLCYQRNQATITAQVNPGARSRTVKVVMKQVTVLHRVEAAARPSLLALQLVRAGAPLRPVAGQSCKASLKDFLKCVVFPNCDDPDGTFY